MFYNGGVSLVLFYCQCSILPVLPNMIVLSSSLEHFPRIVFKISLSFTKHTSIYASFLHYILQHWNIKANLSTIRAQTSTILLVYGVNKSQRIIISI